MVAGADGRASLGFILVTIFLDVLGIGVIIPVLPQLVQQLATGTTENRAFTFGLLIGVYALMQFLFSPVLGALSDRFGRRPVLLGSTFGLSADFLLTFFAPTLAWLYLARILSGATSASITTANAYLADVSKPEDRVKNFGFVGATFGLGFIIGPAFGGLLGRTSPRLPFLIAACLAGLNFLYGWFVLPESLPIEKRQAKLELRWRPFSAWGTLRRYPPVFGLAGTVLCVGLAQQALQSVWVLYTAYRYGWDTLQTGLSLTAVGVLVAIVQGGLVGRIAKKLGEHRTLLMGLVLGTVSQLLYGLSTQGWMIYAVLILGAVGGVAGPVAQSLITRQVAANEQGSVQGALASLNSLTAIFAPPLATWLFGHFTRPGVAVALPGISFFMGACVLAVGTLIARRSLKLFAADGR